MKLINGNELKGTVLDEDKDYFFGSCGRFTEEEYKKLVIDSQEYFERFVSYDNEGEAVRALDNYYIDEQKKVNGNYVYYTHAVIVKRAPDGNGYVYAGNDGRHRFFVSKKYNLKLLVNVLDNTNEDSERIIKSQESTANNSCCIIDHLLRFFRKNL